MKHVFFIQKRYQAMKNDTFAKMTLPGQVKNKWPYIYILYIYIFKFSFLINHPVYILLDI